MAGAVRRAPDWMQRTGLEWLWRILEEPQLWRRYFQDGVALLNLILTRVMPYAWFMLWHSNARKGLDSAEIESSNDDGELVMRLRGAWARSNLQPLREAFAEAAASQQDLRLDLQNVSYLDAAFLALVLLLYGAQRTNGRRLICGPVNQSVRRIFKYGCSEFLLTDDTHSGIPEDVALIV